MEQQRQFRGVWIPKEIWLNKDLTQQEKMMLVEIDSLEDEEKGCWASNKHFVNLFGITASRASQVIQSLYKKGYIRIDYDMNGKEVETRHIRINRPPYPEKIGMLKSDIGMLKSETGVCQFDKGGYVNFLKENNTYINNTNKNIKEKINKKEKYGEFQNVLLTNEEYHKLEESNLLSYIETLSSYIASKGKKYKSHYATILNWSRKDKKGDEYATYTRV